MKKTSIALLLVLFSASFALTHADETAPLPAHMCLNDRDGSLSIDTNAKRFMLTLGSESFEGALSTFQWFPESAYIIATVVDRSDVRIYANIGIRRNIGFADISAGDRSARLGNPSQLDCDGNPPSGAPFSARAVIEDLPPQATEIPLIVGPADVKFGIRSTEELSRSNYLWQIDGDPKIVSTDVSPTFHFEPGQHLVQLTAVYEVEVSRSAVPLNVIAMDVIPPAPVEIHIATSALEGPRPLTVQLSATLSDGKPVSVDWICSDGRSAHGVASSFKFKKRGEYQLTAELRDAGGQLLGSSSVNVRVDRRQR